MTRITLLLLLAFLPFRLPAIIAVYGDTQANPRVQSALAKAIAAHKPDLVIHTGDLSAKGDQNGYDGFFRLSAPLSTDLIRPARGNHDDPRELFMARFGLEQSYYSCVQDSLRLIFLDSNLSLLPGSEQYSWLISRLEEDSELPSILVLHHPPFSSGFHGGHPDLQLFLPALCAKYHVVAVFSGHDHDYERLSHSGTSYFVSGGGGGIKRPRIRPRDPHSQVFVQKFHYLILKHLGNILRCTAFDIRGKAIDTVDVRLGDLFDQTDR